MSNKRKKIRKDPQPVVASMTLLGDEIVELFIEYDGKMYVAYELVGWFEQTKSQ